MKKITDAEFEQAMTICKLYKEQQAKTSLKSFIEYNKHRMSRRLTNILYKAIEIGHTSIEDLNDRELMRINMCGLKTINEFNTLLNR